MQSENTSMLHSGECSYVCADCNKRFSESGTLKIHQRVHSRELPYASAVCNKGFSKQGNLISHERVHSGERPCVCSL